VGGVFALWGSSLGLALAALLGRRSLSSDGQATDATATTKAAVGMGAWYTLTGGIRLMVFISAATELIPTGIVGSSSVEVMGQRLGTVQGPGLWLFALPVIIFGPVGEELAFRGLLQPALNKWLAPSAAIAITSLVFASLHWEYGIGMSMVVFFGTVLGWARVITGRLAAPIVLHMLINGLYFALMLPRAL
jgi:membrane protease YdiL (CAAX protease family)